MLSKNKTNLKFDHSAFGRNLIVSKYMYANYSTYSFCFLTDKNCLTKLEVTNLKILQAEKVCVYIYIYLMLKPAN